jgi:hypothetical protein
MHDGDLQNHAAGKRLVIMLNEADVRMMSKKLRHRLMLLTLATAVNILYNRQPFLVVVIKNVWQD